MIRANESILDGRGVVLREDAEASGEIWHALVDGKSAILKTCNAAGRQRLENEIHLYGQLALGDDLPRFFGHGLYNGLPYLVIERLYPFESPRTEKAFRAFIVRIFTLAIDLRQADYFHGDWKEANLMQRADGMLVLIDLGTALRIAKAKMPGRRLGSYGYMAPAVQAMKGQSEATENWSIAHICENICPPDILPRYQKSINKAKKDRPEDGFATFEAFRDHLLSAPKVRQRKIAGMIITAVTTCLIAAFSIARYFAHRQAAQDRLLDRHIGERYAIEGDRYYDGTDGKQQLPAAYQSYTNALSHDLLPAEKIRIQSRTDLMDKFRLIRPR